MIEPQAMDVYQKTAVELRDIANRIGSEDYYSNLSEDEISLLHAVAYRMEQLRPIPVGERLPAEGESVLLFSDGDWEVGCFEFGKEGQKWWKPDYHWDVCELRPTDTHWMPLPPKPGKVCNEPS